VNNKIMDLLSRMMGKSAKISRVFKEIKKVSPKDAHVLISGEKGTHKELVAKAIHYNSLRHEGPLIRISFASVPKESAETELFGCGKGGTAKTSGKGTGRMEEADRGTVVLDEISEMDIGLQEKLLKFIQTGEPGLPDRKTSIHPDVRMICLTSKNLKEAVKKGLFIEDLYELLKKFHIKIPPLRERKEDVLQLAQDFLEEAADRFETGPKELSREARGFLVKYNWPCNMYELEQMMKRAAVLTNGPSIGKKDLFVEDFASCSIKDFLEGKLKRYLKEMTKLDNCNLYGTVLSEVESSLISIVLKETDGNQLKAAKTLGINRNTLRTKIKEYEIRV
jgi:DNA-binding NtrC family response regulator